MKRNRNSMILPPITKREGAKSLKSSYHSKHSSGSSLTNSVSARGNKSTNTSLLSSIDQFDLKSESLTEITPVFFKIKKSPSLDLSTLLKEDNQSHHLISNRLDEVLDNIKENLIQASYVGALPAQKDLIRAREEISECSQNIFNSFKNASSKNIICQEFIVYNRKQLQPLVKAFQKFKELSQQVITANEEMKLLAGSLNLGKPPSTSGDISMTSSTLVQKILKEHQTLTLSAEKCKIQSKTARVSQAKNKLSESTFNPPKTWESLLKNATEFYESSYSEVANLIVSTSLQLEKLDAEVKSEFKSLTGYCSRFFRIGDVISRFLGIQKKIMGCETELNKLEETYFSLFMIETRKPSKTPQLKALTSIFKTDSTSVIGDIQQLTQNINQHYETIEQEMKDEGKIQELMLVMNQYYQFRWKNFQSLANLAYRVTRAKEYDQHIQKLTAIGNELEKIAPLRKSFESQIAVFQSKTAESIETDEKIRIEFVEKIYSDVLDPLAKLLLALRKAPRIEQLLSLNYGFETFIAEETFKCELIIDKLFTKTSKGIKEIYRKWRHLLSQEAANFPNLLEKKTNLMSFAQELEDTIQTVREHDSENYFEQKFLLMIQKSSSRLVNLCHTVRPLFDLLADNSTLEIPIEEAEVQIHQVLKDVQKIREETYFDYEVKTIAERQCDFLQDILEFITSCRKMKGLLTFELLQQKQMPPDFRHLHEEFLTTYQHTRDRYNNLAVYSKRIDKTFASLIEIMQIFMQTQVFFSNENYLLDDNLLQGLQTLWKGGVFKQAPLQISQIQSVLRVFFDTSKVVEEFMLLWKKWNLLNYDKTKQIVQNQTDPASEVAKMVSFFPAIESRYQINQKEKAFLKFVLQLKELKDDWLDIGQKSDQLVKESRSIIKEQGMLLDKLEKLSESIRDEFNLDGVKKISDVQLIYINHLKGLLRSQAIDIKGHLELKPTGKSLAASEAIQVLCKQELAAKLFEKAAHRLLIRTGPENKIINTAEGLECCLSGKMVYKTNRKSFICPTLIEFPSLSLKTEEIIQILNKGNRSLVLYFLHLILTRF